VRAGLAHFLAELPDGKKPAAHRAAATGPSLGRYRVHPACVAEIRSKDSR